MYLKGLDEIDRKIIELLTQNARISYVDIGMRSICRVSRLKTGYTRWRKKA